MATSNAATTYLERRVLDFLFKNNSLSFATPGNSIYVGLATAVTSAENSAFTEACWSYKKSALKVTPVTDPGNDRTMLV